MTRRPSLPLILGLVVGCIALIAVVVLRQMQALSSSPAAERAAYGQAQSDRLDPLWPVPEFTTTDQRGKSVSDQDLRGHVWIASFIFTTCTTVCPLLTAKTVMLQQQLVAPELRFVSFSVDPEHDVAEVLARYHDDWNSKEQRWLLLREDPSELQQLAQGMKVAIDPSNDPDNPIIHSSLFFLVDREGQVRRAYDSNDDQALARLVRDTHLLLGQTPDQPSAPAQPVASGQSARPASDAPRSGAQLYADFGCDACHSQDRLAPSLAGLLGKRRPLAGGAHVVADEAYVRESIVMPGAKVVNGYLQLMPSYRGVMSDQELDALVKHVSSFAAADPPAGEASTAQHQLQGRAGSSATDDAAGADDGHSADGTVVTDPVCSMQVRVTKDTPSFTHNGHTHYFCAESCRKRYAGDPSKFAP